MLSEKSLKPILSHLKNDIKKDIERNNINRAIKSLSVLCDLKMDFYTEYYDQDVEDFIGILSNQIFPSLSNYSTKESHVVMIDSMAWDYHGLTQQYLRSFMSMDLNILYVMIKSPCKSDQILRELEEYGKAQVYIFDMARQNIVEQLVDLYHTVVSFSAAHIFLHSFSIIDPILLSALPVPAKYRINFGDHHCWSGVSCTNYMIEFHNWGATLSYQIKGVSKERIIVQPYYPIEDNVPFCGLPEVDEHKVIIFSGGASYKIKDKEMTFLKLVLRLLDENPRAVIFYASRDDDQLFKEFIVKNQLQERFFLIGYRSDLKAVFERIDIYLNTYPMGGALMAQYAKKNGRPELCLIDYKRNIDDLCTEAKKLIQDEQHRKNVGAVLKKEILTENDFNHSISKIISEKKTDYKFTEISRDFESYRRNLQQQSFNKDSSAKIAGFLYSLYSFKYLLRFPYMIVFHGTIFKILEKAWGKLYKYK